MANVCRVTGGSCGRHGSGEWEADGELRRQYRRQDRGSHHSVHCSTATCLYTVSGSIATLPIARSHYSWSRRPPHDVELEKIMYRTMWTGVSGMPQWTRKVSPP